MKQKTFFLVKGIHCASCSTVISRSLKKLGGVNSCEVNYATEKATVEYDPSVISVNGMNEAIGKLGYLLEVTDDYKSPHQHQRNQDLMGDHIEHLGINQTKLDKLGELEKLKLKVQFVLPITILVFGIMMWDAAARSIVFVPNFPMPMELLNVVMFVLATIFIFWVGKPYLLAVVRFGQYRVANMDSLVGIGTLVAYLYSSAILLLPPLRSLFNLPEYTYFDVTIVVIGFVTLGKYLETKSKLQTGEAIEKLIGLQAKSALVMRNGEEIEVPIYDVVVGDLILIKPGEKIPVDGVVLEGKSAVDESMINGESMPVEKCAGQLVIGATINKQGWFTYRATKVGQDTMLAQIIRLVEQAQGSRAPMQNLADKVSAVFIPSVLLIALSALFIWIVVGTGYLGFSGALSYGILAFVGVLVIACPCALGLATPTAIIVAVGKAAEYGILVKNAEGLEKLRNVDTVVLDKTGTVTLGKPRVTDLLAFTEEVGENELLTIAASLETYSAHPLALAIKERFDEQKLVLKKVEEFHEEEGKGVEGILNGQKVVVRRPVADELKKEIINKLQQEGKTAVVVEREGNLIGVIGIGDTIKTNAASVVKKIHSMGIKTIMLTGDNKLAAEFIARQVGIEKIFAEVYPQDKSQVIRRLKEEGCKVAMVGDGINDAPALSEAEVGIAMATGSDIAIESADITLLGGDISKITEAIYLAKVSIRTVRQNLFWAFVYNVIGIPLAAGLFYPIWGIFLNPAFAGLAMAMSSVSVVGNSLLLKRVKL